MSEATQQMSLGIPSLAATSWVLTHLYGRVGIQEVVSEASRVYQDQTDQELAVQMGRGLSSGQVWEEKMSPVLKPDSAGRRWNSAVWGGQESGGQLHIFVTHRPGAILE